MEPPRDVAEPVAAASDSAEPAPVEPPTDGREASPHPKEHAAPPEPVVEAAASATAAPAVAALERVPSDAPLTTDVAAGSAHAPAELKAAAVELDDHVPELRSRRLRWALPLAAVAAIALAAVGLREANKPPPDPAPLTPAAVEPAPAPPAVEPPEAEAKATPIIAPSALPTAEEGGEAAPTTPPASESEQVAEAAPTASAAAEPARAPADAQAEAEAAPSGAVARVLIDSNPPGARLFRRGKEVGTTPFTLEQESGERRAYELVLPGYVTRKVVIDGTSSKIKIGLRPELEAFTGASPRK